ncbi:Bifunctional inhibitor/plant lipid transfer protein/seed storage helical domain containing protein [Trema orientale]|uniref:Bifunctional inhibitor/plant lipid transfer protein/seed storage helical domain containing protein n=1 Tax=Trema orientale TaxID=63057 RepID=A0A2P5AJ63_TREOI|nr:Bifunctional inhibitor/plant lipid transfer protein/seed storage helical domain containing protein [Trema orientale]
MKQPLPLCVVAVMATAMLLSEGLTPPAPRPEVLDWVITCHPRVLLLCLNNFDGSLIEPCCSQLKEQEPCLCGDLKDPKMVIGSNISI